VSTSSLGEAAAIRSSPGILFQIWVRTLASIYRTGQTQLDQKGNKTHDIES
jgi:hypothetical protein